MMIRLIALVVAFGSTSSLAAPKFTGTFTVDEANCRGDLELATSVKITRAKVEGKSVYQIRSEFADAAATIRTIYLGEGEKTTGRVRESWETTVDGDTLRSYYSRARLPRHGLTRIEIVLIDNGKTVSYEEKQSSVTRRSRDNTETCRLIRQ